MWITTTERGLVMSGISLFYLCYVVVGETQSEKYALDYLNDTGISSSDVNESQEDIARRIISTYEIIGRP